MGRKRRAKPVAVKGEGAQAVVASEDEQALGARIAANAAEAEQARADVERLRGEQDAALRDGAGGRERAKALITDILAAERTVELLERERALLADEQLGLRARREVEALRAREEQDAEAVRTLALGTVAVNRSLRALGEALANFAPLLDEFFARMANISPTPPAVEYLSRWAWAEDPGEVLAAKLLEIRGRPTPGLRRGAERFGALLTNPDAIIRGIGQHLRRPEVLANLYPDEPTLVERMLRLLAEGGDGDAQA